MKKFLAITIAVITCTSTVLAQQPFHQMIQNPYTSKPPNQEDLPNISIQGPKDQMVPSTREYIEWYGEPPPDDWDPDPVPIPYDEINTYFQQRFSHYHRYLINTEEWCPGAFVSLYNALTPNLLLKADGLRESEQYLKYNYPLDAREMAWMKEDPDEVLDYTKQKYWAMWRRYGRNISKKELDLSEYFDYQYWKDNPDEAEEIIDEDYLLTQEQEAMIIAYIKKGFLSIPAWRQHPVPNERFTPVIPNENTLVKDYTYFAGDTWDLAGIADKWRVYDQANYFLGDMDIKFGDDDLTFVDQFRLDRANNRNLLKENKCITDDINGPQITYKYFNEYNIATHDAPDEDEQKFIIQYYKWVYGKMRDAEPISIKFKEDMYENVVKALNALPPNDKKRRMLSMLDTLWWQCQYWIDAEYIKVG